MINIDIRFLKHLYLIMTLLFEIINGKYKDTPGERQSKLNIANMTRKQLKHIIHEAETEEYEVYIRRGIVKEANWK